MIALVQPPVLMPPTPRVKVSFLVGEQADCVVQGTPSDWLDEAAYDFDAYVADQVGVRTRWGVPATVFWYVSDEYYLGSLVIRHELSEDLAKTGGHIGYNIVAPWQRQGHATRMLAQGLVQARSFGMPRVLLTCAAENVASRRVIIANGGRLDAAGTGDDRFWIDL
jgi:predicted acetyltransferase